MADYIFKKIVGDELNFLLATSAFHHISKRKIYRKSIMPSVNRHLWLY